MEITIRRAKKDDVHDLVDLMIQMGYQITKEDLAKTLQIYSDHPSNIVFCAVDENQVVGCIATHVMEIFHAKESWARISTLIVDQKWRRKGIGARLIDAAEKYVRELGCVAIELTSGKYRKQIGSHDFYESMGYSSNSSKLYFRKEF